MISTVIPDPSIDVKRQGSSMQTLRGSLLFFILLFFPAVCAANAGRADLRVIA
jgi:hypothetical protein